MNPDSKTRLTTVTPLSKALAAMLFIIMPFVGVYIGYTYAPEKVVEVERLIEKEVIAEEYVTQDAIPDVVTPDQREDLKLEIDLSSYNEVNQLNYSDFEQVDCSSVQQITNFISENRKFDRVGSCHIVQLNEYGESALVLAAYQCGGCVEFYAMDETNSFITQKLENHPYFNEVLFTLDDYPNRYFGVSNKQIFEYNIRNGERNILHTHVDPNESLLPCEHGCSPTFYSSSEQQNSLVFEIFDTSYEITGPKNRWDPIGYQAVMLDI